MRHPNILLTALLLATTGAAASAADSRAKLPPLALQKHCDECHAVDAARIGPPFLAVAARHSAEGSSAIEPLVQKIIHGGAGNWGNVPMIPNERISPEEARTLVRWILSLKPS
ncbi:MAG TPA: c-type cytochrome [Steroidobacteraceae bacterium]|nr:c-type cytochrome [Steroidobacteraceae bacterium]